MAYGQFADKQTHGQSVAAVRNVIIVHWIKDNAEPSDTAMSGQINLEKVKMR